MANSDFQRGDRVAWSHDYALFHSSAVLREGTYGSPPPGHDSVPSGVVKSLVGDSGSLLEVEFEDGTTRVLTADELVKVEA